jgi:hypothetical protein
MSYQHITRSNRENGAANPVFEECELRCMMCYLASGMTYQEILEDFPYLTQEDILACLSYAAEREHQTLNVQA